MRAALRGENEAAARGDAVDAIRKLQAARRDSVAAGVRVRRVGGAGLQGRDQKRSTLGGFEIEKVEKIDRNGRRVQSTPTSAMRPGALPMASPRIGRASPLAGRRGAAPRAGGPGLLPTWAAPPRTTRCHSAADAGRLATPASLSSLDFSAQPPESETISK